MFRGNTDIATTSRKRNPAGASGLLVALVIAGVAYVGYKVLGKKPKKNGNGIPAGALPPGIHDVSLNTDVFLLAPRNDPSHTWVWRNDGSIAGKGTDYMESVASGKRVVEMRFLKPEQYKVSLYYKGEAEPSVWTIVAK